MAKRSIGLVGMPNVGKSTLFNALCRAQLAQAANYPFCTIEPNVALVDVPDPRLHELAAAASSQAVTHKQVKFVDIAGLIAGAHSGDGLGNKFLGNIRNTQVIANVLRCYDDEDVVHVEDSVDPVRDMHIIENELVLADLASVEQRLKGAKKAKGHAGWNSPAEAATAADLLAASLDLLSEGETLRKLAASLSPVDSDVMRRLQLLTSKPSLLVCNVDEESAASGNDYTARVQAEAADDAAVVVVCAQLEAEVAQLDGEEAAEFLRDSGMEEDGLSKLIMASSGLLKRQTFYTAGETESRAWDCPVGATAQEAAGSIHSDMARGFIKAEVVDFADMLHFGDFDAAKAVGKLRSEGRGYIVQDGDVILFRFNV